MHLNHEIISKFDEDSQKHFTYLFVGSFSEADSGGQVSGHPNRVGGLAHHGVVEDGVGELAPLLVLVDGEGRLQHAAPQHA